MGMKNVAFLALLCLNVFSYCGGRILPEEDDLDIEAQLKILNKPPILTLERHGNIIDCVDFYKQPAFDNPLLKNHSVQINPSFEIDQKPRAEQDEATNGFDKCPDGTVPIRRTTKEDLLRQKSLPSFHLDFSDPGDDANPKYHVAVLRLTGDNILGARAHVGVHNPTGYGNQMTAAFVGITNHPSGSPDHIYGGWAKYPQMFGDDHTHLTIFWSNRAQGKGCFNLLCPGFVQVDHTVTPGNYFDKFSIFEGDTREVKIEIHQDPQTKNWWFMERGTRVGYWPKELFSGLDGGAGSIFFGGVAIADENNVSPQMGFGSFPGGAGHGYLIRESGFMRFIEFATPSGDAYTPEDDKASAVENCRRCYQIAKGGTSQENGYLILFGGPGGGGCTNR